MDELNELLALEPDDARGIGDNHPPTAADEARTRSEALIAAADKWVEAVPIINDEATASKAQDFVDQLRAEYKAADDQRAAEKRVFDQQAIEVQRTWKPILAAIDACAAAIKPLRDGWLHRENMRLEAERREREAAAEKARQEAEAQARAAEEAKAGQVSARLRAAEALERAKQAEAAAAAVPDRARVAGSYGAPARSLRSVWRALITDQDKCYRHFKKRPEVAEVLAKLANSMVRAGERQIPGCAITETKE